MYAKLVVGASRINAYQAIRDIGRLITSESPSLDLLGAFSAGASTIPDTTPAGWSYVGSVLADDQAGIVAVGGSTPSFTAQIPNPNLVFSAPCVETSWTKYAALTVHYHTSTVCWAFMLSGATDATSAGILTNEGARQYFTSGTGTSTPVTGNNISKQLTVDAGDIIHVIANQRHITIISEGTGLSGIWESSPTDMHTYYDTAPFVQYTHPDTSNLQKYNIKVATAVSAATTLAQNHMHTAFNVYDAADGTNYGTYDLTDYADKNASPSATNNRNVGNFLVNLTDFFKDTKDTTGATKYMVAPIFYRLDQLGYPTQFVTGVSPLYLCRSGIGNSGDTVMIGDDEYLYFNCGLFGLLAQTS